MQQKSHSNWWQLKLLVPLMLGLLVLDHQYLSLSPLGHQIMLGVIVLLVYGWLGYWVYVNQSAARQISDQTGTWQKMDNIDMSDDSSPLVEARSEKAEEPNRPAAAS